MGVDIADVLAVGVVDAGFVRADALEGDVAHGGLQSGMWMPHALPWGCAAFARNPLDSHSLPAPFRGPECRDSKPAAERKGRRAKRRPFPGAG